MLLTFQIEYLGKSLAKLGVDMLEIIGLEKTSEVSGAIKVILLYGNCSGIINDWNLSIDGLKICFVVDDAICKTPGIDFICSDFPQDDDTCRCCPCKTPHCHHEKNVCSATFMWDTTRYNDGTRTIQGFANDIESKPLTVTVNNNPKSYRILNKKLTNSDTKKIDPPNIEIEVTKNIAEFIDSLPNKTGYIDMEINSTERFTIPYQGKDIIIGDVLIQRILDLRDAHKRQFGDTIQIDLNEESAQFFVDEFSLSVVEVGLLNSGTKLTKMITSFDPTEFPATNTQVAEGE